MGNGNVDVLWNDEAIHISIYLYVCISIYLPPSTYINLSIWDVIWDPEGDVIHLYSSNLFTRPYIYISIYLSIYLFTYLSIYLYIYVSIYRFIDLSIYLPIYLSIYLSIDRSTYPSIYLFSIYLEAYLKMSLEMPASATMPPISQAILSMHSWESNKVY